MAESDAQTENTVRIFNCRRDRTQNDQPRFWLYNCNFCCTMRSLVNKINNNICFTYLVDKEINGLDNGTIVNHFAKAHVLLTSYYLLTSVDYVHS